MISKRFPTDPYQQLAALARAFTSAARLQILHVLSADEACVCHLTTILGRRQANVSQHLMVLRDARLVEDRRDGMMVYYRLADSRAPEIVALLRDLMPECCDPVKEITALGLIHQRDKSIPDLHTKEVDGKVILDLLLRHFFRDTFLFLLFDLFGDFRIAYQNRRINTGDNRNDNERLCRQSRYDPEHCDHECRNHNCRRFP